MGGKANLTGNILPVSTGLMVVMKPLWVLTGSVTGVLVSTGGGTVVTTTGMLVVTGTTVAACRVGGSVGSVVCCNVGRMMGRCTTGLVGTLGFDFVGQGPFRL